MTKRKENLIFFGLAVGLFLYFGLLPYIEHGPFGMHQGAQADRASIAFNYAQESMNFFQPRVMENRNMHGITGMEFPIIAYASALLYKVFGFSNLFYRLIEALLFIAGQFAAWRIAGFFVTKLTHRVLLHTLWVSSPILIFYSNNFLPEVPALSLSLLAWYQFFRYYYGIEPRKSMFGFALFSTLAALIKITYLIPIITLFGLILMQKRLKMAEFPQKKRFFIFLLIPVLIVPIWYGYARYLTDLTYNLHFLQKINPPGSISEFIENSRYALNTWIDGVYPRQFIILLLLVWGFTIQRQIKNLDLLAWISIGLFLGFLSVFILFNRQFRYHDYYFVSAIPFLFFMMLYIYKQHLEQRMIFSGVVGIITLVGLFISPVLNARHTKKQVMATYTKGDYFCQNVLPNIEDMEVTRAFINREMGTGELIVAFDPSPNTLLYYLGRQGIRLAPDFEEILSVGIIQSKIDEKSLAKNYIIINQYFKIPEEHYIHTLIEKEPVFQTGEIWIFKLRKDRFNF